MKQRYLPRVATYDRAREFAQPLLSQRRSGGIANLFVAPALSPDGSLISFISYGSLTRGEIFPDLYLADAETGERITRLVKSTTNPDFEQLRFIYSQPSFSQDGKLLAFTGQKGGKDVLYLMDVAKRDVIRRIELPVDQVLNPAFSPDNDRIVFSGLAGGITDLWVVNVDGSDARRLNRDMHGDAHPQWSPDGRTIAFASDRGSDTDFSVLRFGKLKISLMDVATGAVSGDPRAGRPEHQPAVGARWPVADLHLRPHGHRQPLPVRPRHACALPAHQRGGRHHGGRGVQPGDHVGPPGRPAGVRVLRAR